MALETTVPRRAPIRLLPSLFTTAALAFGLLAMYNIVAVQDGSIRACWYILIAAILDSIDGMIARMTGTESEFGEQYDSLSDAIVFGTAPAILLFLHLNSAGMDPGSLFGKFAQFSCIVYTICGVLRLARYNTTDPADGKKTFVGMPIPAAAATVVSCYLVIRSSESIWAIRLMPPVMLYLAAAMISTYDFHSLKSVDFESPKSFDKLVFAIFTFAAFFALRQYIMEHIEVIILVAMLLYAVSGPLGRFIQNWSQTHPRQASSIQGQGEDSQRPSPPNVREIG